MNNKKLWYPAAMVIALSVAVGTVQAKSLEQVGVSDSQAETMKTYGVDVPAKSGLKTLLPSGWNLFIYKNTNLPQSISWSVGDTWISALERFADKNSLAVRLDWSKKAVYVSSPEVAIEARAKLAEIDNAARTPLPTYAPATVTKSVAAPVAAPAAAPALRPIAIAAAAVAAPQVKPSLAAVAPTVSAPAADNRPVNSDLLARALAATAPKPATSTTTTTTTTIVATPVVAAAAATVAPAASIVVMPVVVASSASAVAHSNVASTQANSAMPSTGRPLQTAALPPLPVTMAGVMVTQSRVASPATPAAAPESASDAFVHGNLEDIVRKTAAKLGYQVSWETVSLELNGPVTFLGMDAAEDMRLLQKSLGLRQSPIAIEVYRGSSVIRVTARGPGREPLAIYDTTYSGLVGFGSRSSSPILVATTQASAPALAPASTQLTWIDTVAAANHAPVAALAPLPVPTAAPVRQAAAPTVRIVQVEPKAPVAAPALLSLKISKGDSLSKAIAQFLKTQGWDLKWQVPNDMEADFPFTAEGPSIANVLGQLLPKLGLDTDMYAPSKMVVVRPIDNTAE